MPAQHGQTYEPQEEPAPRDGWFRLEERPYPERLDRAFRVLAVVIEISAAIALAAIIVFYTTKPITGGADYAWAVAIPLTAGVLA